MKRSRFTEAQVIGILKEAEAGAKTADLARKHAVSEHTIYPLEGEVWRHDGERAATTEAARG
jgi:putative transposase